MKRRTKKQLASVLLAVLMVVTALSVTVFAEDAEEQTSEQSTDTVTVSVGVTWKDSAGNVITDPSNVNSVAVTLYNGDTKIGVASANAENGWKATFAVGKDTLTTGENNGFRVETDANVSAYSRSSVTAPTITVTSTTVNLTAPSTWVVDRNCNTTDKIVSNLSGQDLTVVVIKANNNGHTQSGEGDTFAIWSPTALTDAEKTTIITAVQNNNQGFGNGNGNGGISSGNTTFYNGANARIPGVTITSSSDGKTVELSFDEHCSWQFYEYGTYTPSHNILSYTTIDGSVVFQETIPETESQTQPQTEPQTQPQTQPQTEPQTQPETEPTTLPHTGETTAAAETTAATETSATAETTTAAETTSAQVLPHTDGPATGDNSSAVSYLVVIGLAVIAIAGTVIVRKKNA